MEKTFTATGEAKNFDFNVSEPNNLYSQVMAEVNAAEYVLISNQSFEPVRGVRFTGTTFTESVADYKTRYKAYNGAKYVLLFEPTGSMAKANAIGSIYIPTGKTILLQKEVGQRLISTNFIVSGAQSAQTTVYYTPGLMQ
jgi:hypothetical protein